MRDDVRRCAKELNSEVGKAHSQNQSVPHDNTEVALDLVDRVADRITPDNVVEAKRFLRHCLWATRKAITEDPNGADTPSVRKALEDSRNTCLDISWTKEMRKMPAQRWVVADRPLPEDIPNFERVTENFFRGGQPDAEGVEWLKKAGVNTTIDLRGGDRDNQWNDVDFTGLNHQTIDIPDFHPPTIEQVERAIAIIDDPKSQRVFLHCKAGVGRTGTVTACWRIAHGATADEALAKEKINSYYGSLRQEEFVRDFEAHLKRQTTKSSQPPPPLEQPSEKDHWALIHAYSDVTQGRDLSLISQQRGLTPEATGTLEDFSAFWHGR
jgi:protein tyrosine phosphatase (PTP) superfamily phosphohydrolase (DUF442 family)